MASSLALHNEMVATVVRGFKILRGIEWANELAEEQLFDARKTVAAAWFEPEGSTSAPGPDDIRAACSFIQDAWTDEERECRRLGYARTSVVVDQRQREHKRKYREANREKIAERDRAYKAANREKIAARKREVRAANARQRAAVA